MKHFESYLYVQSLPGMSILNKLQEKYGKEMNWSFEVIPMKGVYKEDIVRINYSFDYDEFDE